MLLHSFALLGLPVGVKWRREWKKQQQGLPPILFLYEPLFLVPLTRERGFLMNETCLGAGMAVKKGEKSGKERKRRVLIMLTISKVCLFLVLCLGSGISLGNFVHTGVPWLSVSLVQNQEIKVKNKPKKLTGVLVSIQILISLPNLLAII